MGRKYTTSEWAKKREITNPATYHPAIDASPEIIFDKADRHDLDFFDNVIFDTDDLMEFLEFLEPSVPESWNDDDYFEVREWVFNEYDHPPYWKGLKLVKLANRRRKTKDGFKYKCDNSIDNCVGEFAVYHNAIARYFAERHDCDIKFEEQPWMEHSDTNYDPDQPITYRINTTRKLIIPRWISSSNREDDETLESFLGNLDLYFRRLCYPPAKK